MRGDQEFLYGPKVLLPVSFHTGVGRAAWDAFTS